MDLPVESQDALYRSLERMGAIERGERPPLVALPGGVSSLIVRVERARGPICVKQALPRLKVEQEWLAPVERNSAELAWFNAVAAIAPDAVPRIVGADAEARAFAMEYLAPERFANWKTQLLDGTIETATARRVGALLGTIHAATAAQPRLAAEFANDATFFAIRLEPYLLGAARAHPECRAQLQALVEVTARTRCVLVHGDVSPKNILIGARGPVLLDAECAWWGEPAFDLAFCLNHLLLKCLWRPAAAGQYLACFDALALTYFERVDWEPAAALEERCARLLPGLMLARIDGKSPVEYLTAAADKQRVRDFAVGRLLQPERRLASLRSAWAQRP